MHVTENTAQVYQQAVIFVVLADLWVHRKVIKDFVYEEQLEEAIFFFLLDSWLRFDVLEKLSRIKGLKQVESL